MPNHVTVRESYDVRERAEELDCNIPHRFSIIPSGLREAESADELVLQEQSVTIRKLIEQEGVSETPIDEDKELYSSKHRSAEFVGPALFFTVQFLSNNWDEVEIIIETIKLHLDHIGADEASLSFVVEKEEGDTVSVDYDGPAEDLDDVLSTIEEVTDD